MKTGVLPILLFATVAWTQPTLRKQGTATQLIVDGKPFLMLAGELHNSSASSLEYMKPIWRRLAGFNLNTVLATVSWELVEPEEGKFDFALVDGLIRDARANRMRLVFLWFGSWKNGVSTYPPSWVKRDVKRFPRAQGKAGKSFDVISPLSTAARDADARAFAALMRHIREVDERRQTVVMIQVQNEVGLLGDSRDRSPLAQAAWNKPVPRELLEYLQRHKSSLLPEIAKVWNAAGARTSGTWPEVFGTTPWGEEVFMAWHLGTYVEAVARAGKTEYNIPMFVNAWLVQNDQEIPGDYPSGGPVSRVHDIWRAAAPSIDVLAPDIYLPGFQAICASYTRSGNPLWIPEARGRGIEAVQNLFYAIGEHSAMGFSPFAIDALDQEAPLGIAYKLLSGMAPVIATYQGTGKMTGFLQGKEPGPSIKLGEYTLSIGYPRNTTSQGYGILIATGQDEFLAAGSGFNVSFSAAAAPSTVRIDYVDEGRILEGIWVPGRRLNGDETMGGTRLVLPAGPPGIQKIKLYRHD